MTMVGDPYLWWLVKVRPNYEKKISYQFNQMGIQHLMPISKEERKWKDRKKIVLVPALPGYIFVYLRNSERLNVFIVNGVLSYVSNKSQPIKVNDDDIKIVQRMCDYNGEIKTYRKDEGHQLEAEVALQFGHFKGLKGRVVDELEKSVLLHIESLGRFAEIKVNLNN